MSRRHSPEAKASPARKLEIAARKERRKGDPKFTQIMGSSRRQAARARHAMNRLPGNLPSDSNHAVRVLLRAEKIRPDHPMRQVYQGLAAGIRDQHHISQHAAGEF